jgi:hypothetical protein
VVELKPLHGPTDEDAKLERLKALGAVTRTERRPLAPFRPIRARGGRLVSEAIVDDREDRAVTRYFDASARRRVVPGRRPPESTHAEPTGWPGSTGSAATLPFNSRRLSPGKTRSPRTLSSPRSITSSGAQGIRTESVASKITPSVEEYELKVNWRPQSRER